MSTTGRKITVIQLRSISVRDRPFITCGERLEDILIYLMEFSSPSQTYVKISVPIPGLQKKLHTPALKCTLFFIPPPLSLQNFGLPARCLPSSPLQGLMTGPLSQPNAIDE